MELCIISREIVKPSSPTPSHLRTHKLSVIDQIVPDFYFPFILFYSGKSKVTIINNTSTHLKNSLSETLTHYYPFAGRVKDGFSIDCDDNGVTFIEARVANEMAEVLNQQRMELLQQLLPCNPLEKQNTELVIQVNYFGCGGMAICALFNHAITDGTSAAYFLKNWAAIACGSNDVKNVIFDCTSIFPPQDVSSVKGNVEEAFLRSSAETVVKRFRFDGNKIAALREKIGNIAPGVDRPTRFEALSALILGAVIATAKERDEPLETIFAVNLRKRMNPQLPRHCIGNLMQAAVMNIHWQKEKTVDYNSLAGKVHESIKMVNDDCIRKLHAQGGYVNFLKNALEGSSKKDTKIRKFWLTSWCRLPFYETDFGWGKPIWATTAMMFDNTAILFDTNDGAGIEACLSLPKEYMAKFEQDPAIISYTCFNNAVN